MIAVADCAKPIVFYDGGCPLCKKEIAHYQALDKEAVVLWVDITEQGSVLESYGVSFQEAMTELHAVTESGVVVKGVDSFLLIWQNLKFYRHVARLVISLRLNKLLNVIYKSFARWRLKKRCGDTCDLVSRADSTRTGL